jgi:hypothetical protein
MSIDATIDNAAEVSSEVVETPREVQTLPQLSSTGRDVVEFNPAVVGLYGKTLTEKRLTVLASASTAAAQYLIAEKGKVGSAARAMFAAGGVVAIAKQVKQGNYKPLAEALAVVLGRSIIISNRASYESLDDTFEANLIDLKDSGFKLKDGVQTPTPKRAALVRAITLVRDTRTLVKEMFEREQQGE